MAKAKKDLPEEAAQAPEEKTPEVTPSPAEAPQEAETREEKEEKKEPSELEKAQQAQAREHDQYLRLAAEFDNFRKRSAKEKDSIYQDARAETAKKFLPVYDNLDRALKNDTSDEAYKKGVEMTMRELV